MCDSFQKYQSIACRINVNKKSSKGEIRNDEIYRFTHPHMYFHMIKEKKKKRPCPEQLHNSKAFHIIRVIYVYALISFDRLFSQWWMLSVHLARCRMKPSETEVFLFSSFFFPSYDLSNACFLFSEPAVG